MLDYNQGSEKGQAAGSRRYSLARGRRGANRRRSLGFGICSAFVCGNLPVLSFWNKVEEMEIQLR